MIWYCDTSALVKRYIREESSHWFRQQLSKHQLVISVLAISETSATLARRYRQGTISKFELYRDRGQFNAHLRDDLYLILPATRATVDQSAKLIYAHPLAAYDAVHLATALDYLRTGGIAPNQFRFVTADDQLRRAAESENLLTENPNDHQ
ncbi:MAG: type II toxin-antitoxin system VapC family toxin [Blastocatellia bacterium]